jgi:hypothetical protein
LLIRNSQTVLTSPDVASQVSEEKDEGGRVVEPLGCSAGLRSAQQDGDSLYRILHGGLVLCLECCVCLQNSLKPPDKTDNRFGFH